LIFYFIVLFNAQTENAADFTAFHRKSTFLLRGVSVSMKNVLFQKIEKRFYFILSHAFLYDYADLKCCCISFPLIWDFLMIPLSFPAIG